MSTDIATLGIKVDASDVKQASGELRVLVEVGTKAEKATDGVANSFGGLKNVLAGLGLGALIREGIQLADTYSNIRGRLSLVTNGTTELNSVTEKLFESSQRARASFEGTSDLYSSLARSTKSLGTSQTDLLQVTETINKALIVSGASASTAEGALVQLGQGFASGTLRGDELNAVLEGTPRLAQAIADGMGVTVGQLRALGAEGKITGETVFNALKSQKDAIETEFSKMPTTVSQSFVVLRNEVLKYIGEANQASGVTALLSNGIVGLSHNLDTIATVVEVLAVVFGVKYVTALVATTVASVRAEAALIGLTTSAEVAGFAVGATASKMLGFFGGGIGVAITGVALGIGYFATESSRAGNIVDTVNKSYDEMRKRLNDAKLAADSAAGGSSGVGTAAHGAVPGVEMLTGKVAKLADELYRQADAAKKARIEMAATSLAEARKNELAAAALTPGARNRSNEQFVRGDFLNNAGVIGRAIVGGGRSLLSGGRTDREAEEAYAKAVRVSIQAKKDLNEAYQSSNSAVTGAANVNAAEIKKLQGQVDDLKKLRGSLSGKELKRADAKITAGERKIQLLGSGAAEAAVNTAVGSGGSGSSGKSDAERDYESRVKASQRYIEQLQNETSAIGLNSVEQKLADAQREAAKAPTEELRQRILQEAQAWAANTTMQEANELARRTLKEEMERQTKATEDAKRAGADMAEQLRFEAGLQRMSIEQRTVEIAKRDMENKGIREGTIAYMLYGDAILDAAKAKGQLAQQADDAGAFADHMRAVNDNVKNATDSFAQLFGTAGAGFSDLIQTVSDYAEQSAAAEARIAEARSRYGADSVEAKRAEAEEAEAAGTRELATYGRVIAGVKGLFKEKSTAYKVMEGIEKAYAAVRLALAIREVAIEVLKTTTHAAGAGTRMATDAAETASSVSKSGIRAAADGVAAFAKTLASLPFPLNLVAGAAVLAALVAVGVKIAGGGGKGASGTADTPTTPTTTGSAYSGPVDEYGQPTSSYSVLKPGRTAVANDNGAGGAYGSQAGAARMGGFNIGDTNLTIQGNVTEDVLPQVQAMLDNHNDRVVQAARAAVAQDNAASASRQRIGGSR